MANAAQGPDNFIRVFKALEHVCSKVGPSIDFTIRKWHAEQISASNIQPCSTSGGCQAGRKPKVSTHCPDCVKWGSALEKVFYQYPKPSDPSKAHTVVWKNITPSNLYNNYIEVANGFVLNLPDASKRSQMEHYDTASVLKVILTFGECHNFNKPTQSYQQPAEVIDRVSKIRNNVCHSALIENMCVDDQTLSDYFSNITDFVCCMEELSHLSPQEADQIRAWLDKTKTTPVSLLPEMKQAIVEALQGRTNEEMLAVVMKRVEDYFKDDEIDPPVIAEQLKANYRETRGTVNMLPGCDEVASMEDIFVELDLTGHMTGHINVMLGSYYDVIHMRDSQGYAMKRVIVKGQPGCGKSTLISKLAYDWATIDSPLSKYQMVFAIDLKDVMPGTDLLDVIQEQLLPKVSKRGLENYLECNAKDVLFLLDGYDELPKAFLKGSSKVFKALLSSKLFTESVLILTTRPHKVPAITNLYKSQFAHVEIHGLPRHSIFNFISKFFKVPLGHIDWVNRYKFIKTLPYGDKGVTEPPQNQMRRAETIASLILQIGSSEHVLHLCRYPMTLTMLCYVWNENQDFSLILTKLYVEAIYHVAKNRCKVDDEGDIDIPGIKKRVDDLLFRLGEVALEGLLDNRVIFTSDEFDTDDVNNACEVGLLSRERKRSRLNPVNYVAFLHKTFQEMSAGRYLGHLSETDEALFSSYVGKLSDMEDKELMLRFCCGANSKAAKLILSDVVESSCELRCRIDSTGKSKPFLGNSRMNLDPWRLPFLLLFEADQIAKPQESKQMHSLFEPLVSKIQIEANSNEDLTELWAVVTSFANFARDCHWSWMSLVKEAVIIDASNQLASPTQGKSQFRTKKESFSNDPALAKAVACMSNMKVLTLLGSPLADVTPVYECLIQSDKAPKLTHFTCKSYFFMPQPMAQFLSHQKTLTKVHIESVVCELYHVPESLTRLVEKTVPKEMKKIVEALSATSLKVLLLEDVALGPYVSCLKPLLPHLQELQLSCLFVKETNDCKQLLGTISDLGIKLPLLKLSLAGNQLDVVVDEFVNALKCLPDLKFLDIKHFDYRKPGKFEKQHFKVFCPALRYVQNLISLDLQGNSIDDAASEVGSGLQSLNKLKSLCIGATDLTEECVEFLPFEKLQNLETLSIGSNQFGNGLSNLSKKLKYLQKLRSLEFSVAHLTDDSVTLLPLSCFPNLTFLDLRHNDLWSNGVCFIANQLKCIPHLEKLFLSRMDAFTSGDETYRHVDGIEALVRNFYHVPKLVHVSFPVCIRSPIYRQSTLLTECVNRRIFEQDLSEIPLFLYAQDIKNAVILVHAFNLLTVYSLWIGNTVP